jgi:hypothetical protein
MHACTAADLVGRDDRARLVHTDLGLTHLQRYAWLHAKAWLLTWSGVMNVFAWCIQT